MTDGGDDEHLDTDIITDYSLSSSFPSDVYSIIENEHDKQPTDESLTEQVDLSSFLLLIRILISMMISICIDAC